MIKIDNITKIFGKGSSEVKVLKNISLEIQKGEFVAIIGPSGSGKSTLMNILGILDTATTGKYFLNKKDISGMTDDELAQIRSQEIGFVFQSFNLLSTSNVIRNVKIPLLYNNKISEDERLQLIKKALKAAGLDEEHFKKNANLLSGGQKQRVAIARALINNPNMILADEPTGNLDSKTGAIVLKTFKDLNQNQGRTIILITHEDEVANAANRIIHIKDGQITSDKKNK